MSPYADIPSPARFKGRDLTLDLHVPGSREYLKLSYPVKYGVFSRLETETDIFEFTLNRELRHARSKTPDWLHPQEWLKRSAGNHWIYYSTGGYAGVFEALGEYYLPNLTYTTNALLGGKPFKEPAIDRLVSGWYEILADLSLDGLDEPARQWMISTLDNTPDRLARRAQTLLDIIGAPISVMPPDARHSDYNFIPIHICDGCLYKCRFCKIKNKHRFTPRSGDAIARQIKALKAWYGPDLINCNALFLGDHDALNAPDDLILDTAAHAYEAFGFKRAYMTRPSLYLFGSLDALMSKDETFFTALNRLPFSTFINLGLESAHGDTLDLLGKPITPDQVRSCFEQICRINRAYPDIEISCNFVMGDHLPRAHYDAVMSLIREGVTRTQPKGAVYLSPLTFGRPSRQDLYDFYRLKAQSRFPTFLYLIQRF